MRTRYVGAESSTTITQLTVEQFLDFSPRLRALMICERLVQFWDEEGAAVPLAVALDELEPTWLLEPAPPPSAAPLPRRGPRSGIFARDRRRHVRHPRALPLRLTGPDARYEFGVTENVSDGGMLLRTEDPLEEGTRCRLEIPHAGFEASVVVLRTLRARRSVDGGLAHAAGVVFDVPPISSQRAA